MQFARLQSFSTFSFLLVLLPSLVQSQSQRYQGRDIFSPIESLADSILGITTTQNAEQTVAGVSLTSQTPTTQDDTTVTATPQVVTVVPTIAATSFPTRTSSFETSSGLAVSDSTSALTAHTISSSSASAITNHSTSQSVPSTSSPISSTPTTPANPIQGLSSSSAGTPQEHQDDGNSVSAAGVAVGVVFGTLIFAGVVYLLHRHYRGTRDQAVSDKPSEYNELKRTSYSSFDYDEEQGLVHNPGLGLGKVANLKPAPNTANPDRAESYRTRSRAGSEDTLSSAPTIPVSPLDRRAAPLPPLPFADQDSWPMIAPVDAPYPKSLLIARPATTATSTKDSGGYTPYRRAAEPAIGVAVPLGNSHMSSI